MKIYLSHNWAAREWLATEVVPKLTRGGFNTIVSRWLTEEHDTLIGWQEAQNDLIDVARADLIVVFTDNFGSRPGRGKYVELGLALALRIPVLLVGAENDCVFYNLPQISRVQNVEDLIRVLG